MSQHRIRFCDCVYIKKVQGKTMPKIILDLNTAPGRPMRFSSLYTSLTRVQKGDLKILPICPGKSLQHFKKISADPKLIHWLRGFDKVTGKWSRSTSDAIKLEMEQTQPRTRKR